jgi:Meckel syndrome type 1 protein
MNPNAPDTDPLDESEQALARIVRALPAGEPPSALDARILKAASDAVAAAPGKRRTALLSATGSLWGIGSAAAAVLAIGIAWQRMNPPMPTLPATSPAPVAEDVRNDGRLPVEFKQEAPRQYDNSPPPAAPAVIANRIARPPVASAAPVPAAATAFPQDSLDEHVAQRELQAPAAMAAPALGVISGGAAADNQAAPAEPRAEAQATSTDAYRADAPAAKAMSAERDQAAMGSLADADGRVAPDTHLYPESWLLKIRTRLKDGDVEGARASLRLFVAKYPTQTVPDDLKALLKE